MKTFAELAIEFTRLNTEFNKFELDHRQRLPRKRKHYELRLKQFAEYLSNFADLQYEIIQLAAVEDPLGRRAMHVDAINIILNKIQFLYMVPLSMELSRNYNIFNIRLAVVSILIGALLGMMQPYIQPNLEEGYRYLFAPAKQKEDKQKPIKQPETMPVGEKDHLQQ